MNPTMKIGLKTLPNATRTASVSAKIESRACAARVGP
eukprot:CAMPEP_0182873002 /NCGR_PEP_ID=MMETSP0034_2-20130328/12064_1 /TAXON_ID=156128 /ORGANISM="Nephroselmis pyriformis, Strain CCMP717" /LENGTH=36 /DNA_ID= /DNA_START= /DNA_END= /DNA_ORIENTATION=